MDAERTVEWILDELDPNDRRQVEDTVCEFLIKQGYYVCANVDELREMALEDTDLVEKE